MMKVKIKMGWLIEPNQRFKGKAVSHFFNHLSQGANGSS
jgi:hypothetical protein